MSEQVALKQVERDEERRIYERVPLILPARFLGESGEEVECETSNVSANGVCFRTARPPGLGESVIAYIRDLGRVQGVAVRHLPHGFAMTISAPAMKTERLAQKIAQLAAGSDRRLFQRLELDGAHIALRTPYGEEETVEIVDVSTKGVAFRTDIALRMGDRVHIGGRPALVARLFDGGAAASFV